MCDYHRDNTKIVKAMYRRFLEIQSTMIPPDIAPDTKKGNPNNFGGFFSSGNNTTIPRGLCLA